MISTAIYIFNRHVWAGLALFYSAFFNYIIIVYLLIRPCANKALERLFSADLETFILYTTVLRTYCLETQLSVVFSLILRFSELNSINIKYLYLL
jgi:hypothetical protein